LAEEPSREWSPARRVEAIAGGPPGQRLFELLVETQELSARVAVEKEQLQVLAMLVEQLLTGLPAVQVRNPELEAEPERPAGIGFPAVPDVSFRVARLSLGIDQERDLFVLMAYASEEEPEDAPALGALVTRGQMRRLSQLISYLISGGRPRCPLCQAPLTPGQPHHCAGSNGHVSGSEPE
jgi:uncharacterized repeat protein (TIGR03847 family)